MSQNRALPSVRAAGVSLMKRWTSGGAGTGRLLSEARARPPPPPPAVRARRLQQPADRKRSQTGAGEDGDQEPDPPRGSRVELQSVHETSSRVVTPRVPPRPRYLGCAGGGAGRAGPRREGA